MVGEGAAMAAAMAALLVQIRRFDRHHHRVLGGCQRSAALPCKSIAYSIE